MRWTSLVLLFFLAPPADACQYARVERLAEMPKTSPVLAPPIMVAVEEAYFSPARKGSSCGRRAFFRLRPVERSADVIGVVVHQESGGIDLGMDSLWGEPLALENGTSRIDWDERRRIRSLAGYRFPRTADVEEAQALHLGAMPIG